MNMTTTTRHWLRCAGLLVLAACLSLPVRAAPGDAFFDTTLGDYAEELKTAQQQGKTGVLLVFEAEGCPFCKRMREGPLSQKSVQDYFRSRFNIFHVDFLGSVSVTDFAGKDVAEKAFGRALKVRGTPTFLFVAPDGSEMARYSGVTRDADEFMALGRFVVEGHYRKTGLSEYLSNPNASKGKK